ncbi:MAG TPA: WhiB family transcriptional regulator [Acidimicrobiales bacterium]|nr:WhiB family transcriptional regulator [Acidimicrobiales bacterium]
MQASDLPSLRPEPWQERAACKDAAGDFFATDDASVRLAKSYCLGSAERLPCPVRRECLDDARDERFGIWGGLDEEERHKLRTPKDATGRCAHCGESFVPEDRRQRYCTPRHASAAASAAYNRRRRQEAS